MTNNAAEHVVSSEITDPTTRVLYEMLLQRMGGHFLDSGGSPKFDASGRYIGSNYGYGRHWERNQGRDFESEPAATVSFSVYESRAGESRVEINLSLSTYHFLRDRCELAEELDSLLHGKFLSECDPDDAKCWLELMDEFPEYITKQLDEYGVPLYGEKVGGIYGDRDQLDPINTYNHQSLVDQTLQYKYFTLDGEEFCLLQVHQGADVRGGYGTVHCFKLTSELAIFDDQRATLYCTGQDHHEEAKRLKNLQDAQTVVPGVEIETIDFDGHDEHYWCTDDGGSHWYLQSTCGRGYQQLETHEVHDLDAECDEDAEPFEWKPGVLCIKMAWGIVQSAGQSLLRGQTSDKEA